MWKRPLTGTPNGDAPSVLNASCTFTADIEVPEGGAAEQKMPHTIPLIMQWDENLDVGSDTGTPVADEDYQVPFPFDGTIGRITLELDRPVPTEADKAKLEEAMQKAADQR